MTELTIIFTALYLILFIADRNLWIRIALLLANFLVYYVWSNLTIIANPDSPIYLLFYGLEIGSFVLVCVETVKLLTIEVS